MQTGALVTEATPEVKDWLKSTKDLASKFGDELTEEHLAPVHYGLIQGWFACYACTYGLESAKQLYSELFDVPVDKVSLATDCPVLLMMPEEKKYDPLPLQT